MCQPCVNDKRVEAKSELRRFASAILPAQARGFPQLGQVLPLLCSHGLLTNEFIPASEQFLAGAEGLSAVTIIW